MSHAQPRRQPDVTPEQLALAYRHMARPGWADTLDAALAHPVYGPCIRGLARNLGRAPSTSGQQRPRLGVAHIVPPTQTAPRVPSTRRPGPAPYFHARRAAANDLDD